MKPDITAPGFQITSAVLNQPPTIPPTSYDGGPPASGTSISAPHVTGVIALLFEKNPTLTQEDIRNVLLDNAKKDNFTGGVPNVDWGHGKLDAESAYDDL
jgi:subtilisin family serine protease